MRLKELGRMDFFKKDPIVMPSRRDSLYFFLIHFIYLFVFVNPHPRICLLILRVWGETSM